MPVLVSILAILFALFHAILEGIREARFYHHARNDSHELANVRAEYDDEHLIFFWQRLIVLCLVATIFFLTCPWWFALTCIVTTWAQWTVWHDEAYYSHRNDLDITVYPLRDQSDPERNGTAKMNFTAKQRAWLWQAAGLAWIAIVIIYCFTSL